MGLFKPDAPKPPDYGPLIKASAESAKISTQLAQEQFAWAKKAYTENKAVSDQVTSAFLKSMSDNAALAAKDRARYESVFQPLENSLVKDANEYGTPERRAQEMGRAQAGVAQQFEAKRQASTRELESYGINPSATRFAALDIGLRAEQGAAEAAAADAAGRAVDDRAMALRADAINLGRGYPAQGLSYNNASGNAGAGAAGTGTNLTASGASSMGTGATWNAAASGALGQQGQFMGQQYSDQLAYQKAQNEASGWGALLGVATGIGGKMLGLSGGGAIPAPNAPYFDQSAYVDPAVWNPGGLYSEGGPVRKAASPSHGAIEDDVPARLTAGEFVIPVDVMRWKGEEYFHRLVDSSRAKKSEIEPPPMRNAIPHPATFESRARAGIPQR